KFVPALAESWRPLNDTTWRFTLRKGVSFHDGSPFTADSVLFTLKRVRDNGKLIKSFVYQDIEDVQKDGDYTVTVTTKRPFGSLPAHLTMLGMLPPSAAAGEEAFFQKPAGTGPFRFVSWTHGDRVELAANTKYWKPGVPRVEKVTVRFIPELSTRAAALRAGEIHVIDRGWPDLVQTLKGTPGVKVNIRNLEIATAREQRTAGNYDLFYSGWAHMPHDPDWYFGQWFTKAGAEKLTRFSDPRVEQLIAEGRVPDPKVRQQKYAEIER